MAETRQSGLGYNPDVKEALFRNRAIKEERRAQEIGLKGQSGEQLAAISKALVEQAEKLLADNGPWVQEKFQSVRDYLKDYSDEEIQAVFLKGLAVHIKQYFRLFKKTDPAALNQFNDRTFCQEIIQSFFIDFVRSLRSYKKQDLTPAMALKLARVSYQHNSDSLIKLQKQYPDVDPGIIKYAAVTYPGTPRDFIEKTTKTIAELQTEYPDLDRWLITRAAVSYPDRPKKFIETVMRTISELRADYPDTDPYIIKYGAVNNPSNPKEFVDEVLKNIVQLQKEFPQVDARVIKYAAINNPHKPKEFVEKYLREGKEETPDHY